MRSAYYTNAQGRPQDCFPGEGQAAEGVSGWGTMASVEHERITGVWGTAPSRVQGQSPWTWDQGANLDRGSGGRSPLKLKAFWSLDVQRSQQ